MVGRSVLLVPDKPEAQVRDAVLRIEGLTVPGDRGADAVRDLSLEVRGGEIVGIAGVSGNGQRELAEAIAGLRKPSSGSIEIEGNDVAGATPAAIRTTGFSYVPEERMRDGAIKQFNVSENLMLVDYDSTEFSRYGFLRFGVINEHCEDLVEEYAVKTPTLDTRTGALSGGNIQKLILARELSTDPRFLLAAQPTRGVDIGAAEYIHKRLIEQRDHGTATLVISEDLDEVLALSDRVAVMFEGRVVDIVDPQTTTREQFGLLMTGVTLD
jgi:simple sugar transport system ATP-binding protein